MIDISTFVAKHRKQIKEISIGDKINSLPWYKKPIERSAFISRKGKDGKYYVKHNEWAKAIWIGPYETMGDVDNIINSYVEKSLTTPLDRLTNTNAIHSVYVENVNDFF